MTTLRERILGWAALLTLHLGLLFYFAPPSVIFDSKPVMVLDYSLHVYQVVRAKEAFADGGALWGWDPLLLAGQPAGVVEDLTSKGTELWVIALSGLGVHPGLAFNLLIFFVHISVPFAGYLAARLFRLRPAQGLAVALLWVLLWYFDSFLHWSWFIGMISWAWTCQLVVLFVGVALRLFEESKVRLRWALPLALLAATISLVHPFGVVLAGLPVLAIYLRALRAERRPSLGHHGALWGAAACGALTTLVWIGATLRFRHYVGDIDTFFNATLSFALSDYLDLLRDGRQTGGPVRTMLRYFCFVAAGITFWRWRRAGDSRLLPMLVMVLTGLVLAYVSAYSWHFRQTQPYRQIGPLMLLTAIPAVVLLGELLSKQQRATWSWRGYSLLALALVLIVPRFARTVLWYVPSLLPERVYRLPIDRHTSPLSGLDEPRPGWMGHAPVLPQHEQVREFLRRKENRRGRVVVQDWVLGEYLAASSSVPILGGIRERNVPHVDAHLFRLEPNGALKTDELRAYLERYAVGWVVLNEAFGPLDKQRDLLEPAEVIAGYRFYRVRAQPSYFARGKGVVAEQRLNLVRVTGAAADPERSDLVLRVHWMESLACRPGCQVEREQVPGDRVGFVRVPNPPAELEIFNQY